MEMICIVLDIGGTYVARIWVNPGGTTRSYLAYSFRERRAAVVQNRVQCSRTRTLVDSISGVSDEFRWYEENAYQWYQFGKGRKRHKQGRLLALAVDWTCFAR